MQLSEFDMFENESDELFRRRCDGVNSTCLEMKVMDCLEEVRCGGRRRNVKKKNKIERYER